MKFPSTKARDSRHTHPTTLLQSGLLLVWLLMPTLMALGLESWDGGPIRAIAALVFSICVFVAPLTFLGQPHRLFLFWLPVGLIVPLQTYLIFLFGSVPGDAFTDSLLHTSLIEIRETLSGFGWLPAVLPLCWVAYIAMLRPLAGAPGLRPNQRKGLLAALLLYVWMAGALYDPAAGDAKQTPEVLGPQSIGATFPAGSLMSLYRVLEGRYKADDRVMKSLRASAPETAQTVILVIGETLRADHLGLNGYSRNTTPELSKLGSDLLTFSDVAATANYTSMSVPKIIEQESRDGTGTASLVSVFRESGYKTAWLSNQDIALDPPNAHITDFTETDWKHGVRYDTVLLPKLAACLKQCGDRQFIVLHLLGSHFPYDNRYAPSTAAFTPTFRGTGAGTVSLRHKQELINSYDNSVLATDRLLANVIAQASRSGKPALVLFTADHGENLYDDERKLVLHSGHKPSRAEAFVPLLVWTNAAYRQAHPEKVAALSANRTAKTSHLDVMPTILDMAGVEYDGKTPSRSLASPAFAPTKRFVQPNAFGKPVDVDTLR